MLDAYIAVDTCKIVCLCISILQAYSAALTLAAVCSNG